MNSNIKDINFLPIFSLFLNFLRKVGLMNQTPTIDPYIGFDKSGPANNYLNDKKVVLMNQTPTMNQVPATNQVPTIDLNVWFD